MHFGRQLKTLQETPRRTMDQLRKLEQRHCRLRTVLATVSELGRQARFRLGNALFVAVQLPDSPEVRFEEMMPKGVNQGARPDVISPKPVSGQLPVGHPGIGTSAHAKPCFHQGTFQQVDRAT
jgi:hypothetical protein